MNDSREDLASLYVLDQLDAAARAEFETRLLHDPALAALVRELQAALDLRIRALPPVAPPADLLARIEHRLDATPAPALFPAPPRRRWTHFTGWGLAAVIALSLATLAVQSLRRPAAPQIVFVSLGAQHSTLTEVSLPGPAHDADTRFQQIAALAVHYWEKPDALPGPPATAGTRQAYTLFDPASQQGFIAVEQLPPLASGQTYHLWIVDPATHAIRDAGILPLTRTTRGLYSFALAPTPGDTTRSPGFFITVEDAATSPARPRGHVVLGDQRI